MKKECVCCLVIGLVLTGFLYSQETPFEGKWSAKLPGALFFDTVEYTFRGNIWTLSKFKNGRVAEVSEGTFTYTQDYLIMQERRYKTTGEWQEMKRLTEDVYTYTLSRNTLSIDGFELTRIAGSGNSRVDSGRTGGLYYSIALPKGWAGTKSHK
jgi:hypothetical protein